MQNVNTMIRRPVPLGTAAITGLLAFAAGAVLAFGVPVTVARLATSHSSSPTVAQPGVGAEQVAHDRSEQGFGAPASVGSERVAHNRSERAQ